MRRKSSELRNIAKRSIEDSNALADQIKDDILFYRQQREQMKRKEKKG